MAENNSVVPGAKRSPYFIAELSESEYEGEDLPTEEPIPEGEGVTAPEDELPQDRSLEDPNSFPEEETQKAPSVEGEEIIPAIEEAQSDSEPKEEKIGLSVGGFVNLAPWGQWVNKKKKSKLNANFIGFGVGLAYKILEIFSVSGSLFYNSGMSSKDWKKEYSFDLINFLIKAKGHYKLADNIELNGFLGLGLSSFSFENESSHAFALAPGAGATYFVTAAIGIDFSLSYLLSFHDKDLIKYSTDLGHVTGINTLNILLGASYHL